MYEIIDKIFAPKFCFTLKVGLPISLVGTELVELALAAIARLGVNLASGTGGKYKALVANTLLGFGIHDHVLEAVLVGLTPNAAGVLVLNNGPRRVLGNTEIEAGG